MIIAHKHYSKRWNKKQIATAEEKLKRGFDKAIMVVAILVPLSHLPQLIKIWGDKNALGVSLASWVLFTIFTLFWLIYGLLHREKPIIVQGFFLFLFQLAIVIGIALYN